MPEPDKVALEPKTCATGVPGKLYTVRLYDGFDNNWIDLKSRVDYEEARRVWNEETKGGTEKTRFDDIDYYDIFEADTKMLYSDYVMSAQ
jgi:hypothetical protein